MLVLQEQLPRHVCMPWRAARARCLVFARGLPVVLPECFKKGKSALEKKLLKPAEAGGKKRAR